MRAALLWLSALFLLSSSLFGQGGRGGGILAASPANANRTFSPHDLTGYWSRNGNMNGFGGGSTCRD